MRKAKIEEGVVTNIIEVDADAVPAWCADWPDASEPNALIGSTYEPGNGFTPPPSPSAPPPPVPQSISFAQLLIGLVSEQWITEAEGEAWLAGALPAPVLALIATLPADQQFAAKARAIRPAQVERMDPLVNLLGAAQGKTAEELDQFFRTYAQV